MSGDGRPAEAAKVIDFFFNSLYASAAEPLGRDGAIERKAVLDPDCLHGDTAWDDPQADELLAWAPDRPPVELHAQFAALTSTPDADVGLPVRCHFRVVASRSRHHVARYNRLTNGLVKVHSMGG